jgi:hypothetical protein
VRGLLDEDAQDLLVLPAGPATLWRVRLDVPQAPLESRTIEVVSGVAPLEVDFDKGD